MKEFEVIIVGGGPAGTQAAYELVRNGISTVILDKADFPRQKLCAGWITPQVFKQLGIYPSQYPHSLKEFQYLSYQVFSFKLPVHTRQYAIIRTEFDQWMLKRCQAPIIKHEVKNIEYQNGQYIIDQQFKANFLIGAGGTNCPVYRIIFQQNYPRDKKKQIVCLETEFQYEVQDDRCYLWFFQNKLPGYSWYVPKTGNILNLGIGGYAEKMQRKGLNIKSLWRSFVYQLKKKKLINDIELQPKGYHYYLRNSQSQSRLENAFLIGDALGLATKDMGEGIGPAIESARLAAQAIVEKKEYDLQSITSYSLPGILFYPKA
ncbi:MAG: NAD(P)/FAD-dependent oxidoreductase [Spirochaetes bacterium]|nr:NAD(P)/FAD-dependent oxidoreductase [Spirochaetota bacterium]